MNVGHYGRTALLSLVFFLNNAYALPIERESSQEALTPSNEITPQYNNEDESTERFGSASGSSSGSGFKDGSKPEVEVDLESGDFIDLECKDALNTTTITPVSTTTAPVITLSPQTLAHANQYCNASSFAKIVQVETPEQLNQQINLHSKNTPQEEWVPQSNGNTWSYTDTPKGVLYLLPQGMDFSFTNTSLVFTVGSGRIFPGITPRIGLCGLGESDEKTTLSFHGAGGYPSGVPQINIIGNKTYAPLILFGVQLELYQLDLSGNETALNASSIHMQGQSRLIGRNLSYSRNHDLRDNIYSGFIEVRDSVIDMDNIQLQQKSGAGQLFIGYKSHITLNNSFFDVTGGNIILSVSYSSVHTNNNSFHGVRDDGFMPILLASGDESSGLDCSEPSFSEAKEFCDATGNYFRVLFNDNYISCQSLIDYCTNNEIVFSNNTLSGDWSSTFWLINDTLSNSINNTKPEDISCIDSRSELSGVRGDILFNEQSCLRMASTTEFTTELATESATVTSTLETNTPGVTFRSTPDKEREGAEPLVTGNASGLHTQSALPLTLISILSVLYQLR